MSTSDLVEKMRRMREQAAAAKEGTAEDAKAHTDEAANTGTTTAARLAASLPPSFLPHPGSVFQPRNPASPCCVDITGAIAGRAMERVLLRGDTPSPSGAGAIEDMMVEYVASLAAGALESEGSNASAGLLRDAAYEEECRRGRVLSSVNAPWPTVCRDYTHYRMRDKLAQGEYGVVFSATAVEVGAERVYALKHIKRKWLEQSRVGFPLYLLREFDLLLRIRHPNVVKALEVVLADPNPLPAPQPPVPAPAPASDGKDDGGVESKRRRLESGALTSELLDTPDAETAAEENSRSGPPADKNGINTERAPGEEGAGGREHAEAPSEAPLPSSSQVMATVGAPSNIKDVFLVMEYSEIDLRKYMTKYVPDDRVHMQVPLLHLTTRNCHEAAPQVYLSKIKCIFFQLCRGLEFLHRHRILHRDLKSSNVLITHDGRVQLCDFGLGRQYREGSSLTPNVVTPLYRAPELFFGVRNYGAALDIWGAGCILAELFLKKPLFAPATNDTEHILRMCNILGVPTEDNCPGVYRLEAAKELVRGAGVWNRENRMRQVFFGNGGSSATATPSPIHTPCLDSQAIPASGIDLLNRILCWNPSKRPSASEILEHSFFREEPLPCQPAELLQPLPWLSQVQT